MLRWIPDEGNTLWSQRAAYRVGDNIFRDFFPILNANLHLVLTAGKSVTGCSQLTYKLLKVECIQWCPWRETSLQRVIPFYHNREFTFCISSYFNINIVLVYRKLISYAYAYVYKQYLGNIFFWNKAYFMLTFDMQTNHRVRWGMWKQTWILQKSSFILRGGSAVPVPWSLENRLISTDMCWTSSTQVGSQRRCCKYCMLYYIDQVFLAVSWYF